MSKYNVMALFCLSAVMMLTSCGKNNGPSPDTYNITGINLTDYVGQPAGTLGTPNVKTFSDSFFMVVYPVPCYNEARVSLFIGNTTPTTLTIEIINGVYKNAPDSIVVQNTSEPGKVVLSQTMDIDVAPLWDSARLGNPGIATDHAQKINVQLDVSQLPQGFYRLYVKTTSGFNYWDNIWIVR
jgi:hypothetical protein